MSFLNIKDKRNLNKIDKIKILNSEDFSFVPSKYLKEEIKKDLKWKPKISIEEGIKRLIKNLDYWKKGPVWTPSLIKKQTKSWYKYLK